MRGALPEKALALRELHRGGRPLVLVNAWDAVSARIVESLGFPAVATTSSGVANGEGFPDGQQISRAAMLARVETIAGAVDVPVTADLEGGYGLGVDDAIATARGALDAAAVGLNFEDSTGEPDHPLVDIARQAERIRAIRRTGDAVGVPIVINARTDAYRHAPGDAQAKFAATVERAKAYIAAGCDSVFVPFVADDAVIGELVKAIPAPLNILAGPSTPPVARLAELGVRRISLGGGPAAHALAAFRDAALEVRDHGTYGFTGSRLSHADLNALFAHA
jgi:2-methylisocitrate lyase-like PEP mutase family enzyme